MNSFPNRSLGIALILSLLFFIKSTVLSLVSSSIVYPRKLANLKRRRTRTGSSSYGNTGAGTKRSVLCSISRTPPKGSIISPFISAAIAFIVKSLCLRSSSMHIPLIGMISTNCSFMRLVTICCGCLPTMAPCILDAIISGLLSLHTISTSEEGLFLTQSRTTPPTSHASAMPNLLSSFKNEVI